MSWSMQLGTGNRYAVIHATCGTTGNVNIRAVKFVDGTEEDSKSGADAMAETLGIDPSELYVIPAGGLTQDAKRGRHAKD